MKKYSKISQILHHQFLNKNEITSFFLDRIRFNSKEINLSNQEHIFITGLARSGTTALLQSIDNLGLYSSFRYKYMPFILSPKIAKIYSKFYKDKQSKPEERIHGDNLKISFETLVLKNQVL